MNRLVSSLVLPLAIGAALAPRPGDARSVIVELDGAPGAHFIATQRQQGLAVSEAELQAYRDGLSSDQQALLDSLSSQGIAYTLESWDIPDGSGGSVPVDARYTLVFNGMGLDMDDSAIDAMAAMPGVKAVHPVRLHHTSLAASVPYVGAPELYGAFEELTPFDDLREGLEGQGLNIAVVDSGVEWSHEMFGGDATPPRFGVAPYSAAVPGNEKVTYYLPLFDAVVDSFGHGTHVASTAAGYLGHAPGPDGLPLTADDEAVHGVAPQARIMGYQVCNGIGSTSGVAGCLTTSIILALEDSVSPRTLTGQAKPVAHVINLSLGGSGGPDDATAVAADNAALTGAVVVAAAGNDGPGASTLGSPAAGRHVIAVAASNDPGVFPNSIEVVGAAQAPMRATQSADSNAGQSLSAPVTGRYVFAGLADTPDQVPLEVLGNICLVLRGSTAEAADNGTGLFANKAAQCEAKGAIATVVYNNEPGDIGGVLAPASRPLFTTSGVNGQILQDLGYDAAGVSLETIRLTPPVPELFDPTITGFSSRGPVEGLGQVKPDVAAPGEAVMAATTPVGVPVLSMQSATRYIAANGTSMATPHVAGAAALVKQAHLDWTPDMIRTALINTATNPRLANGLPEDDGPGSNDIMAQGGGLIDVFEAANAQALMGVAGDGIIAPGILGSHSFGEAPVVNSRVLYGKTIEVQLRDVSDTGGTYLMGVANNRHLDVDGIDVHVNPGQVTLPPGGSATVNVQAIIDGDVLRDTTVASVVNDIVYFEPVQMQWFVTATRADGGETLRMPFFFRPAASLPATVQSARSETFSGLMPASDTGLQLVEDVTFIDYPVGVGPATFNLVGELEFGDPAGAGIPDLDLFLLDPDGVQIAESTNAGGPEKTSARVARPGTYTWRVVGWLNAATAFELVSTQELGGEPPLLDAIAGDAFDADGVSVSFDDTVALTWQAVGDPDGFEVERSLDGGDWTVVAELPADTTEVTLVEQPEGRLDFRMRALFPGQIGAFVSAPGDSRGVIVDRRSKRNITPHVETRISNVVFEGGVFSLDLVLTNDGNKDYLPRVEFDVVKINSGSGSVTVLNADNGGDGTSKKDAARFDYSDQLGEDAVFSIDETTGTRHLRFADPMGELFTFKARITGHVDTGQPVDGGEEAEDDFADEEAEAPTDLLQFVVNPLTGEVVISLIQELI